MITFRLLTIIGLFLFATASWAADKETPAQYLKQYSKISKLKSDAIDSGYKILESTVSAMKDPKPQEVKEVLDLSIFLLEKDPSNYAAEVILPAFEKHKDLFDAELAKYPKKSKDLVIESINDTRKEAKYGNG